MSSLSKHYLIALCAWEVCVIGAFTVSLAVAGSHIWGKNDLVWMIELVICGLFVVGVAAVCRHFGRVGGAIAGALCGLVPTVLLISWVLMARPGFEESAGAMGFATILVAPSGTGGAFAGLICASRKVSATS